MDYTSGYLHGGVSDDILLPHTVAENVALTNGSDLETRLMGTPLYDKNPSTSIDFNHALLDNTLYELLGNKTIFDAITSKLDRYNEDDLISHGYGKFTVTIDGNTYTNVEMHYLKLAFSRNERYCLIGAVIQGDGLGGRFLGYNSWHDRWHFLDNMGDNFSNMSSATASGCTISKMVFNRLGNQCILSGEIKVTTAVTNGWHAFITIPKCRPSINTVGFGFNNTNQSRNPTGYLLTTGGVVNFIGAFSANDIINFTFSYICA